MQCCWGNNCLTRLIAAIPETIVLANFSIWLPQLRFASMSTLRDFDVDTWFTGVPLILRTGEAVRVFTFCLEPISINSILVMLSVSLLVISHLLIFSKSSFKQDWSNLVSRLCIAKTIRGPNIVPWGIPHWREQVLESEPLTEHIWVRFSKYDLNQL